MGNSLCKGSEVGKGRCDWRPARRLGAGGWPGHWGRRVRGERQVGLEGITIIPMCLHSSHPCLSDCPHVPCQGYLPLG